jgi:RNA polymerase sigma-70 factor (ECF subfamily)
MSQSLKDCASRAENPPDTDRDLVLKLQQGNQQALGLLYDRHSKLVYSIARRILYDPSDAEDVLQEIFLQLWRIPDSFVVRDSGFSSWLSVVTRNHAIQVLQKRKPLSFTDDLELVSAFNLATHCEVHLMSEKAEKLMLNLTTEERRLLDMAFFRGMTHSEIAESIGYPLGTVKTRIRHALSSLRTSLQQQQLPVCI